MRAAKTLAVLAIAALGIGSFSAVALAGKPKKLKVKVDFSCDPFLPADPPCGSLGQNPTVDKSGLVIAQVELFQRGEAGPCFESRSLRLQVVNRNGVALTTLDRTRTGKREKIWTLSGQLPTTLPAGTNYVRVKMEKRTVGKVVQVGDHREGRDVCQAGVSPTVDPSNGEIVAPASPK
jgi:hypothetical protein